LKESSMKKWKGWVYLKVSSMRYWKGWMYLKESSMRRWKGWDVFDGKFNEKMERLDCI